MNSNLVHLLPPNLNQAHHQAIKRRRRIIVQYDALGDTKVNPLAMGISEWQKFGFQYIDEPGSQIDSIWWDCDHGNHVIYPSKVLSPFSHPSVKRWLESGLDCIKFFVEQTHRRELEVFWNHRIAEVDIGANGLEMDCLSPIKQKHPNWVIKTWWWQGTWNLAIQEVREFKLQILHELAENYDFDGFQIDYARHVPVLPVGRQWELRENITIFMRMIRNMLLGVAAQKNRPILLSAKIPHCLKDCHSDGFDIETWVREGLVDMLVLGSRSLEVDIEDYRQVLGSKIKLYPCIDDHHASDGYRYPPIEVFRGVTSNWWQQGADGVVTFNWHSAPREIYITKNKQDPGPKSEQVAYHEIGDRDTLKNKSKIFPVERRGNFPWAEGAFNKNATAQLPVNLRYDGTPSVIELYFGDKLDDIEKNINSLTLRITISNAKPGDVIKAELNGKALGESNYDYKWKDPQIFSPAPQPPAGANCQYKVDPNQKLLLITYVVKPYIVQTGKNIVGIWVNHQEPHVGRQLCVEKVEMHLQIEEIIYT